MRRGAASCPGGAGQLSRGGGGQAAAQVPSPRSRPGWPRVPRRRDPGEVGPPSGWSPVARMSGRRPGRSLPCPRPRSHRDDVRPIGRADIQCPGVRCPGVRCIRCPDGQACGVRGAAAALSAPRWTWSGSVWRAAPAGSNRLMCRRGPVAAWSPACIGPDGKGMVRRWPWLARMRVDPRPGLPRGRHPGYGTARRWADHERCRGPGCRPGGGERTTEQVLIGPARHPGAGGRLWAWTKRW